MCISLLPMHDTIDRSYADLPVLALFGGSMQRDCGDHTQALASAIEADFVVAVVGLGGAEGEGHDRGGLTLPGTQVELLTSLRAAMSRPGQKLVVVVVAAGPVDLNDTALDAALFVGYGGQSAGYGATDVIFGKVSPSGRFATTVYQESYLSQVGPIMDYSSTSGVGRTYR